jgi:hypothetical protein
MASYAIAIEGPEQAPRGGRMGHRWRRVLESKHASAGYCYLNQRCQALEQ